MAESIESENLRRAATEQINREGVPDSYDGPLWDTEALTRDFEVIGFAAPCVVVRRKEDGQRGTLYFTHMPRVYFDFVPV
jgi:hypothetical protein